MGFQKVDAYLSSLGERYQLKGTDCKVMRNHEVLFRKTWGYRDYSYKEPVTPTDLYEVYSCTKVITMVAAMQCVERGLFQLDDPVEKYISEYAAMTVAEPEGKFRPATTKITIRNLMTMTSGLSYNLSSNSIKTVMRETNGSATAAEVAEAIAKEPLLFEPGTGYAYSLGHDVIAGVIEIVTGMRYGQYLKDHIFTPLGLSDMFMQIPEKEQGRVSAQYGIAMDRSMVQADIGNPYRFGKNYDSGGAGLVCTVDDYAAVMDALACGGTGSNGTAILSPSSIDEMRRPQLTPKQFADFTNSFNKKGYSYGLGVRTLVDSTASASPIGEFGWDGWAGSYGLVDVDNRISIVYAQQVIDMHEHNEINTALRDLVYEAIGL